MKLLLVEDHLLVAQAMGLHLTEVGHEIVGIAADAHEAVELAGTCTRISPWLIFSWPTAPAVSMPHVKCWLDTMSGPCSWQAIMTLLGLPKIQPSDAYGSHTPDLI